MAYFEKIASEIEKRIQDGLYKPGEKIPSIRRMAVEFDCNKLTVQRAFDRLKRDGVLENVVGSGSYVRFPEKIRSAAPMYDFGTDYVSERFFPYRKARRIADALFDSEKSRLFSTTPAAGDPEFLRVLGDYYHLPTRRMFVISGAQQGLDLTAKVFATRISDAILFEEPTYPGAISLFKARHFVPMGPDGPRLNRLDRALTGSIQLFYTMPSVHNPTGVAYSLEKKEAIAERARRHPFYIIEDDYLSEFLDAAVPRFVDIIPDKTIYIKSLSQTTAADIRMGFMIVPEILYDKFLYTKFSSDIASPGLLQKLIRELITCGDYAAHVTRIRKETRQRQRCLLDLIAGYEPLSLTLPQWGYSLWVKSDAPLTLAHAPWVGGGNFSFNPAHRHFFRLSFMNMDAETFDKSLDHLKTLLDRVFRHGHGRRQQQTGE